MNFTSYAQNFEDVMLWRALKHVQNGCYVDIGAQHPVVDSVSKAFYEHGWRGIHVEPVPEYAEMLRQDRPDEIVLQAAIGSENGTLELNVIPGTGLSTGVRQYAENHYNQYGFEPYSIQVPQLTLKSGLNFLQGKEVHWLKIDVEGLEAAVLRGWDYYALRPWIIVIEATVPTSALASDLPSWTPILEEANYIFAYFDGLNQFYTSREHSELLEFFKIPPNVFDAVQLSGLASSELCRKVILEKSTFETSLNEKIAALENKLVDAENRLVEAENKFRNEILVTQNKLSEEQQAHKTTLLQMEKMRGELEVFSALQQSFDDHLRALSEANRTVSDSLHGWKEKAEQAQVQLNSVYASNSWLITTPLRKAVTGTRSVFSNKAGSPMSYTAKCVAKPLAVWTMKQILARPHLRKYALDNLARMPEIKQRLKLLAVRSGLIQQSSSMTVGLSAPNNISGAEIQLSRRADNIYRKLKQAIEAGNS